MTIATMTSSTPCASTAADRSSSVNNIEVIYDHVILVLKGVSLDVPQGRHRRAARRQRRRQDDDAEGDLQPAARRARRGHQGPIEFDGERGDGADAERPGAARLHPGDGRPPLLRPSHHRGEPAHRRLHPPRRQGRDRADLEMVYRYFPRLKERRDAMAGYTSGGEQQMCAIGRALMSRPKMILLDEPSMGLAPQIVEEIFEIVEEPQREGGRVVPARRAEHQHGAEIRPATATSWRTAAS